MRIIVPFAPFLGAMMAVAWSGSARANLQPRLHRELACAPASLAQYDGYLADTLSGLEAMRGKNGLLADSAEVLSGDPTHPATLKIIEPDTGPTNIALDLLVQTALAKRGGPAGLQARKNLEGALATVGRMPFHYDRGRQGGLFYRLYRTDRIGVSQTDGAKDLSSVDNVHLALALWTISQDFQGELGKQAKKLFDRIDFSDFYDSSTGLAYGNIHYDRHQRPPWQPEKWDYGDLGSEARDVYTLGDALQLFRDQGGNPGFVGRVMKNIDASMYQSAAGKMLHVYDGGAFQLLLPEILTGESRYSALLGESSEAYAPLILADGSMDGFPGAFSACQTGLDGDPRFHGVPSYVGEAGNPELVINPNYCEPAQQALWSAVMTPHAAVLAAATSCGYADELASVLAVMQGYASGTDHLYTSGIGWSDGVYVKSVGGVPKGQVVPAVLSLDDGMLALAILRMDDPHGLGPSADALYQNPATRARLQKFFGAVDRKLARSPVDHGIHCGQ